MYRVDTMVLGMTYRAVIFDVGGVIVDSPLPHFEAFERRSGLPAGTITALIGAGGATNAWARHERGEIDLDTFAALFGAEAAAEGHAVDGRALLAGLVGPVRPEMAAAIETIRRRGLLVGLLTNTFPTSNGDLGMGRPDLARIVALADAVVESSRVGLRKPEPEFYELACRRLRIAPREAVFLDDLGVNLKTARALGMRTIKVDDVDGALAELEDVLGFSVRRPLPGPDRRKV